MTTTQKTKPCYACETGQVRPTNLRGREFNYRDEVGLIFDEDLTAPVCDKCGEIYLRGPASDHFGLVLERRRDMRKRAAVTDFEETLTREFRGIPKAAFEDMLGVSHGYLSRLARGSRTPDAALEILLRAFAADPIQTLRVVATARPLPEPIRNALAQRGRPAA